MTNIKKTHENKNKINIQYRTEVKTNNINQQNVSDFIYLLLIYRLTLFRDTLIFMTVPLFVCLLPGLHKYNSLESHEKKKLRRWVSLSNLDPINFGD